jgi:hypothetical protein
VPASNGVAVGDVGDGPEPDVLKPEHMCPSRSAQTASCPVPSAEQDGIEAVSCILVARSGEFRISSGLESSWRVHQ